ncbi:MAG: hypothetical protein ACTSO3_01235 [Candidatus Heimdallarchaeaceae archaeon]
MIDLVAGYARGYNAEQIRPFLKSLRETGYKGKILLFANGGAAEEAKNWNVDLRPCPKPKIKVHSDRFVCLQEALENSDSKGILLSDTRDVIFQRDPALGLPSDGLNAFEEDDSKSIETCPYNSLWIKLGYDKEMFEKLKTYPISCVGTVCGDAASIKYYLKRLREEVERIQPKTLKPQDQGAHNYLIRGQIESRVWHNEEGEIYTVGYIHRGSVKIENDNIVNQSGKVPTVIHQWDRHKNLTKFVEGKY